MKPAVSVVGSHVQDLAWRQIAFPAASGAFPGNFAIGLVHFAGSHAAAFHRRPR